MPIQKNITERALTMLRSLPRISLANIQRDPHAPPKKKRGRGQYGGDKHGSGNKSGQRQNYMRLGYETGNNPFYLRFSREPYYKGHHLRREYPPLTMLKLQRMIDLDRIDISNPIDITALTNTGLCYIFTHLNHHGFNLTDVGVDLFKAKINIEVQWATEPVIAAIERNGGVITTAYYDPRSLSACINAKKFFSRGDPIPLRMLPPHDAVEFYTSAKNRGYLADPEEVSKERFALAQKYGYELPRIEDDPLYPMLSLKKDPRQTFYGLEPGWVISLKDKTILKPEDEVLKNYYKS